MGTRSASGSAKAQGPTSICGALQQAKKLGPVPLCYFLFLTRSPRLPPRRRSRRRRRRRLRVTSRSLQPTTSHLSLQLHPTTPFSTPSVCVSPPSSLPSLLLPFQPSANWLYAHIRSLVALSRLTILPGNLAHCLDHLHWWPALQCEMAGTA